MRMSACCQVFRFLTSAHSPWGKLPPSGYSLPYPSGSSSRLPYLRGNTPSPLTGYFPYIGEEFGYSVRKAFADSHSPPM